jgi:hypothetical protein
MRVHVQDVLVGFSRDSEVCDMCVVRPHATVVAKWRGSGRGGDDGVRTAYPPCGILPHRHLCLYIVPLCYLYDTAEQIHNVFRRMVSRRTVQCRPFIGVVECRVCCVYCVRYPVCSVCVPVCSMPATGVASGASHRVPGRCCRCASSLKRCYFGERVSACRKKTRDTAARASACVWCTADVGRYSPALFCHLTSIGCSPVSLAFPWIRSAFALHLEIKQVCRRHPPLFSSCDVECSVVAVCVVATRRCSRRATSSAA